MSHCPQYGYFDPEQRWARQQEMNALVSGVCRSCGDELENGKSIDGNCHWCSTMTDNRRWRS